MRLGVVFLLVAVCFQATAVSAQTEDLLDRCEANGNIAGLAVSRVACKNLKSKCPVPVDAANLSRFGTRIATDGGTAEDLLFQVLRNSCTQLFQISCKNNATAVALDVDEECAALLLNGPDVRVVGCENKEAAVSIFQSSLFLCNAVPNPALPKTDKPKKNRKRKDPCVCAEDGVSGGVDTGFKGCAPHLIDFDDDVFCYVVGGKKCKKGTEASRRFPGAYWKLC